ncbi:molecular chaperone [Achromobacter seleniivolatilans]|uniref:Molecular chaperone n=1 Tax=Achromobacter seleniivolatilans TaxID=3047478 RepID=A0ABY9LU51_9BURK|nr:molecular chaperone [Achromobacter sp. R39]WMD18309.1 molecular chaperone [Achromobacter sp. R39]
MVRIVLWCVATMLSLGAQSALASIALKTTRVIIEDGKNEASFGVQNMGADILVQSWLEAHDEEEAAKHFTLTPQLVRVMAASEQRVRILYEGVGAPSNKELMLWLNVQEIPQKAQQSGILQLAVRHRIKVFYRPSGLPGKALDAARNIAWSYSNGQLHISNPTAFHVTIASLTSQGKSLSDSFVLGPGQTQTVAPKGDAASGLTAKSTISFTSVNDFGAHEQYRVELSSDKPAQGKVLPR